MRKIYSRDSFTKEQKMGFIFMLVFAILTISLGALQLRNTLYGPFVVHSLVKSDAALLNEEQAKLQAIDTDQDGVSDYEELSFYSTSPYLPDTDSDGLTDKTEIDQGTDPLCPEGTKCAGEEELLNGLTPDIASPLLDAVQSPTDVVTKSAGGITVTGTDAGIDSLDINDLVRDPHKLRDLLLRAGKISPEDLAKINDQKLLEAAAAAAKKE
mgnify:CR=1 FL=1